MGSCPEYARSCRFFRPYQHNTEDNHLYLTSCVNATQLRVCGCVPETNAAISCSTSRGKKPVKMGWPSNCLNSSCVLTVLEHWLSRALIPDKKLRKRWATCNQHQLVTVLKLVNLSLGKGFASMAPAEKRSDHLLYYHFHLKLVHGYHETTSVHKPEWIISKGPFRINSCRKVSLSIYCTSLQLSWKQS